MDNEFTSALENHAQTPDVFEAARTRLAYGARLRRSRQRMRSREQLRAAIDQFDLLGASPWSKMARAELTATGETARQPGPSTRDQLTPQELQIALLLAGGRTTREAAGSLFLSPKTVEYHLRSVYGSSVSAHEMSWRRSWSPGAWIRGQGDQGHGQRGLGHPVRAWLASKT